MTKFKIDGKSLRKTAGVAVEILGKDGLKEISLVLVGEAKIKALNKKYLNRDRVTDVLSFEDLNEIFICLPQAKRQSKLLKTPLKSELMRLLVHGIVHLKGYEHEKSAKEAERMLKVEEKILEKIL